LNIYNWSTGKGNGWDKFVQKIGVAPVVYDPDMVDNSIENLKNHLEYLGYYHSDITSSIAVRKKRVNVTYNVNLGKRFPIKEITYKLPDNAEFAESFFADTANLSVKVGDYLSEAALQTETERSSAFLRNKGFYNFNKNYYFFEADTLAIKDSLSDTTGGFNGVISLMTYGRLLLEFIILFFIAYAVIKLIMRSRNQYYSTLRILGATKKNTDNILKVELVLMMIIAYPVDMAFVALVKLGYIRIKEITKLLYYLTPLDYGILFGLLLLMSLLIANRYSRNIFTRSAMKAFREGA
jgi:predicted lysophospholipase L1 biosynthesis ABC-type transport system permease subunit